MKIDSISVNLPKNVVQYLIGFGFYSLIYGSFDPVKLVLGLVAYVITYSAIYPYNDLMDYDSDKKDEFKRFYKALARGDTAHKDAVTLVFGLPVIGLLIASFVGWWYMMLLITLLLLNFLYSAPQVRLKKRTGYALLSIFLMQFIKYSLGWFTFTTEVIQLPVWIIIMLSFAYIFSFFLYKKNLLDMKDTFKRHKGIMIPLTIGTLGSYVISIIIYPYKIPLLLTIPLTLLILTMRKQKNIIIKTFKLQSITIYIMGGIVLMLLLLNVPVIGSLNNNASQFFNDLGSLALENASEGAYNVICSINQTLYSYPIHDLNELNRLFNINGTEIVLRK
jgi:4-hydroxybenzoate polyprenyltransferase